MVSNIKNLFYLYRLTSYLPIRNFNKPLTSLFKSEKQVVNNDNTREFDLKDKE